MRLLGQEIKAKENLVFSLRRYQVWWLILLVTMAFDCLTTLLFVDKLGPGAEANRIVRFLIEALGPVSGAVIGKFLQLIAVVAFVCLHRRLGNLFLLVVIVLNCWAVVINSFV